MRKHIILIAFLALSCDAQCERLCPQQAAAAGLPFKIAKINGWSECYLKCPSSWVPADEFNGCPK